MNDDLSTKSLGKAKTVCGVTVRKMPLGAYLSALDELKTAPSEFMRECFPDAKSIGQVLDTLSELSIDELDSIVEALIVVLPKYAFKVISVFCGVSERELLESEELGLDGLLELIDAIAELNGLGKFGSGLKKTLNLLGMKKPMDTGFKN